MSWQDEVDELRRREDLAKEMGGSVQAAYRRDIEASN
jgi:hypothetical protein